MNIVMNDFCMKDKYIIFIEDQVWIYSAIGMETSLHQNCSVGGFNDFV